MVTGTEEPGLALGLPVGLPAASVYLSMLAVSLFIEPWLPGRVVRLGWTLLLTLSGVLLGAAAWLIGVQAFVLESFCTLCLTAHAVGLVALACTWFAARLPRGSALAACGVGLIGVAATLPAGQLLLGEDGYELERLVDHHKLEPFRFPNQDAAVASDPRDEEPAGRIRLLDGLVRLDPREHPRLGAADSQHGVVFLFDYTCVHCRRLNDYLQRYGEREGADLAIIALPTPLSVDCNRHAPAAAPPDTASQDTASPNTASPDTASPDTASPNTADSTGTSDDTSCELARLAMAVWLVDPAAFPEFHSWLFEPSTPPRPEDARREAERRVGVARLQAVMADGSAEIELGKQTELYGYVGGGLLPKLLLPQAILSGTPDSAAVLARLLRDELER